MVITGLGARKNVNPALLGPICIQIMTMTELVCTPAYWLINTISPYISRHLLSWSPRGRVSPFLRTAGSVGGGGGAVVTLVQFSWKRMWLPRHVICSRLRYLSAHLRTCEDRLISIAVLLDACYFITDYISETLYYILELEKTLPNVYTLRFDGQCDCHR